jgi:putative ABC transport system permease protein
VLILLRLLSWPYFRKHILRTVLTTAGIVLGVGVFVGMHAANDRVLRGFSDTVDRIAGRTELQVTAGEAGFAEDFLEVVQSASTVRIAVPVIEALVDPHLTGEGSLLVLGIDMTGDRSLRDYDLEDADAAVIDDPLIFLAQPDSIMVSKAFADRHHLRSGSRLRLGTIEGDKAFTVRGIMKLSGLTSAFGGNLAVMDIYAAQKMFGRGRTFDRIELAVTPGASLVDCERELSARLGPAFEVRPPSSRGRHFESMLAGYSMMVNISSAFALFIGAFIIYHAFAIAVTERRTEIGIIRALGGTRRQIRWLFLGESAVIGGVGSLVGVLAGVAVSRGLASWVGSLLANVYGVAQKPDAAATNAPLLMVAAVLGITTSMVAAVLPAGIAARVDPIKALQKGRYQVLSAGESRLRAILAFALGGLSLACLTFGDRRPIFYLGCALALLAILLLSPLLSLALARTLRPVTTWLWPVEGALAADSLIQAPRRTSASVAALMLSLALVVAFEGMARASYTSIVDWMNTTLDPDLFVMPSQNLDVQTIRFPAAMGAEISGLPDVRQVQTLRNLRVTFRGTPVMVVAIEMDLLSQAVHRPPPVAGDAATMYGRAAAGEGVIISDNLAALQRLALGDIAEVSAPYGSIRLPIVGIVLDYSDQQGAIMMDRRLFIRHWHDDSVNVFRVYASSPASVAGVRQAILERYAGQRQTFVLTNDELKQYILKVAGEWFGLTSVQIAVAVLVAVLGIVNSLTVSITDRRRELGVLRAIGALRRQIRRTIWIEALAVGAVGLILGSALGAVDLYYLLQIVHRDIAGMRLDYQFPVTTVVALVPAILGAAFVAALWPAESAVRASLVEALEYE